jgi:hypothetical protein
MRRVKQRRTKTRDDRESRGLDFKEQFNPDVPGEWCELIKDIVAIANSGGGRIVVGVKDNGQPSGWDPAPLLQIDHAKIVDRIARYVGEPFGEFETGSGEVRGKPVATIAISGVPIPMVFVQPGTYDIGGGKQRTAFGRGTVYFRHGAKSEPAHPRDLRNAVERELERVRRSWLGNIRKVVKAPAGAQVEIRPSEVRESLSSSARAIRLVDDPRAPAYRKIDPNVTHPYRQKELVKRVNELLAGVRKVSPYDIQCVRRVHSAEKRSDWYYKPNFTSPQYSDAFAAWIVGQHSADADFFDKCKALHKSQ